MTRNSKLFTATTIIISFLLLNGCSEKPAVIKNGPAGPNTGDLIDSLPEGLIADKQNASHGENNLKPNIN